MKLLIKKIDLCSYEKDSKPINIYFLEQVLLYVNNNKEEWIQFNLFETAQWILPLLPRQQD